MSRPRSASRLLSDSRWNLLAFAISLGANVVALPLAIAAIGLESFGLAGLVLAAFAPFSVLGAILGQGLTRDLARPESRADLACSRQSISLAAAWCAFGCVAVGLIAVLAGPWVLQRLANSGVADRELPPLLAAGFAAWLSQQWCFLAQGLLSGRQAFRYLALATAAGGLATAACVVGASRIWGTGVGFLVGTAAGFGFQILLLIGAIAREERGLLLPHRWTATHTQLLRGFFGWQGTAHFSGSVANQVDRYVLGVTASSAVVGQYNVAMRIQEVVHMGVLKLGEVLLPHFSATAGQAATVRSSFFQRASWLVNLVSVAALAPLIPLGPSLISLWIDQRAAVLGGPMLQTLATAGVVGSGINVYTFFALGTSQERRLARINIAHSVLLVLLAIGLISALGPLAAGWAYVASNLMRWCAAFWFSLEHFAGALRVGQLALASASPLVAGLAVGWGLAFSLDIQLVSWLGLAGAYAGVAGLVLVAAALVASGHGEGRSWLLAARQIVRARAGGAGGGD